MFKIVIVIIFNCAATFQITETEVVTNMIVCTTILTQNDNTNSDGLSTL